MKCGKRFVILLYAYIYIHLVISYSICKNVFPLFVINKFSLQYHLIEQSKLLVAYDWYDLKLTNKSFDVWLNFTNQCKLLEELKYKKAEAHYNW